MKLILIYVDRVYTTLTMARLTCIPTFCSRGCTVAEVDYANHLVRCACNHTTNFAILLQVIPTKVTNGIPLLKLKKISVSTNNITLG